MKPRLLVIGYAEPGFGWGRVLQSLLRRLQPGYDLVQFERSVLPDPGWPWPTVVNADPGDPFGERQLPGLIRDVRPDLVFTLAELWDVPRYVRLVEGLADVPLVAYCPVDGPLKSYQWLPPLGRLASLVLYTHAAEQEVRRRFSTLADEGHIATPPVIDVIPHGADRDVFFPLSRGNLAERRALARAALFPERESLADAFVVLNANRNQIRKRIDLTLEGFRLFAQDKPDNVYLYLHMGVVDQGVNFLGFANRHDLNARLLHTTWQKHHPIVGDRELNLIYNACDVGLNTSTSEGWGLASFEHAATGAAQVVPAHPACRELWDGAAILLDTPQPVASPSPVEQHAVRPADAARALQRLYEDRNLLDRLSDAACRNARERYPDWDGVASRFDGLFGRVLAGRSAPPASEQA